MFANPKLDSAQANTAWSLNTARSRLLRKLTLRGVKQIFLILENLHFQGISDPYDDISKISNIFRKSKSD